MPNRQLAGWGYVYDKATGQLYSEGTVVPDALSPVFGLYERATRLNPDTERWDEATKSIVPHVNAEKIALLNAQRAQLATRIVAMGGAVDP